VGNRHRGRELAFQILYQMEFGAYEDMHDVFLRFLPDQAGNPQAKEFARRLAEEAWPLREGLDKVLQDAATNWDVKRFSAVDRALMRLGAFELVHRVDIPVEVTIDEVVELAKAYSGEESPRFINGVLDQVRKSHACEKKEPGPKLSREQDLAAGGGEADEESEKEED
jgi:N utilization substance protein B